MVVPLLSTSYGQTFDTTGISNWNSRMNSYEDWRVGAFDAYRDPLDQADFGWGNYDVTTHIIKGDSIYILKTVNGNYKAISIDQLASGVYTVTYSNLDGSSKVTRTIDRSNYPNRNFIYHALDTETTKDLEPDNSTWDVLFTKYMTVFPGFGGYPVSGALTNMFVQTSQVEFVQGGSYSVNDTATFPMDNDISTIGYDWKDAFAGITYDTLVYYVKDQAINVNELRFTDYGGSATGLFKFEVNGQLDSVILGAGNVDQVYYSLQNKNIISTNQDHDWDIALYAQSSFSSIPVRTNDVNGVELYVYPNKDINHWNSIGISEQSGVNVITAFPNPATDEVRVVVNNAASNDLEYAIVDQSGRVAKSGSLDLEYGFAEYPIDLNGISKGIYLLQISGKGFSETTRLAIH